MEEFFDVIRKPANLQYAFIDESGSYGFEFGKPGVSSHFIITAIIVDEYNIPELELELEKIRVKHFQNSEMNSQKAADDDVRRIKIIEDMTGLKFHIFSLVVDKRLLNKEGGLYYKKSFIKYLHGIVHRELYNAFPKLQMVADPHGHKEFMEEFVKYVNSNHQPSLFELYDFSFTNSKSDILIRLADFICDTIARGFEEEQKSEKSRSFMNLLREKILRIKVWPEKYEDYLANFSFYKRVTYNEVISRLGIRLANDFIEKHKESNKLEVQEQVIFLQYLKSMLISQRPDRYISSKEIISNISLLTGKKYSHHYFMTKIVARVRDAGVIVASSFQGYKLPVSEKELFDFANQSSSMIIPMLNRLKKCRDQVSMATKNELDILDKPEYHELRRYFEGF